MCFIQSLNTERSVDVWIFKSHQIVYVAFPFILLMCPHSLSQKKSIARGILLLYQMHAMRAYFPSPIPKTT